MNGDYGRINKVYTSIRVKGARAGNLKNIDVSIPLHALTVITGPVGSGKSSLVFHTVYRLCNHAFRNISREPDYTLFSYPATADVVTPAMACVGFTRFPREIGKGEVGDYLGVKTLLGKIFSIDGEVICDKCNKKVRSYSPEAVRNEIMKLPEGTRFYILSRIGQIPHSRLSSLIKSLRKKGFVRVFLDGKVKELENPEGIPWRKYHNVDLVIDRLMVNSRYMNRIEESISVAYGESPFNIARVVTTDNLQLSFSRYPLCSLCGSRYPMLDYDVIWKYMKSEKKNDGFRIIWRGKDIRDIYSYSFSRLIDELRGCNARGNSVLDGFISEALSYCNYLNNFGVGYLSPATDLNNLSTGELQKIKIARLFYITFTGVLFVFDEPSMFMDSETTSFFIDCMKDLCRQGNTVLIIENNPDVIKAADWIIKMGPGSGQAGGRVCWSGKSCEYKTGVSSYSERKRTTQDIVLSSKNIFKFSVTGFNNLRNVSVNIPIPSITCVTGPVGSGKTSLVMAIFQTFKSPNSVADRVNVVKIPKDLKRAFYVSDSLLVKSSKSSVATIMNVLTPIRYFYAGLPASRQRGYSARDFSYTSSGARCSFCKGLGFLLEKKGDFSEMVECHVCRGKRYRDEVLQIRYKGYSIFDIMNLSLGKVAELFSFLPSVKNPLKVLIDLGLDYLYFGQPVMTLSDGEASLLMMARYLPILSLKPDSSERSIFIFDNAISGFQIGDIEKLLFVWREMVEKGHTVIVCDGSGKLANFCDWIIRLGPGGGPQGGEIVEQGVPKG